MKLIKFVLFIILFNFIFGPRFKAIDLLLLTSSCLFVISIYYFVFLKKKWIVAINIPIILLFIGLIYTILISGIYQFNDTTSIELILKAFLYLTGAYFIIELYYKVYNIKYENKICNHIFYIGVFNAMFTCLMYIDDNLRAVFIDLLDFSNSQINWMGGLRVFDLSMGGEASGSVIFGVLFILGLNLFYQEKKKYIYFVGLLFIFAAIIFTGRSGLMLTILGGPLYFLLILQKDAKKLTQSIIKNVAIFTVILSIIFIALEFLPEDTKIRFNEKTAMWAFEQYYNYDRGDGFTSQSMNTVIENMYFLPEDVIDTIFGSSNFGRKVNVFAYVSSDVGYVRTIHALGFIGLIILFSVYVYILFHAYKKRGSNISTNVLLFYTLVTIIFNFKELHYMPRGGASILFLLYISSVFTKRIRANL